MSHDLKVEFLANRKNEIVSFAKKKVKHCACVCVRERHVSRRKPIKECKLMTEKEE